MKLKTLLLWSAILPPMIWAGWKYHYIEFCRYSPADEYFVFSDKIGVLPPNGAEYGWAWWFTLGRFSIESCGSEHFTSKTEIVYAEYKPYYHKWILAKWHGQKKADHL